MWSHKFWNVPFEILLSEVEVGDVTKVDPSVVDGLVELLTKAYFKLPKIYFIVSDGKFCIIAASKNKEGLYKVFELYFTVIEILFCIVAALEKLKRIKKYSKCLNKKFGFQTYSDQTFVCNSSCVETNTYWVSEIHTTL